MDWQQKRNCTNIKGNPGIWNSQIVRLPTWMKDSIWDERENQLGDLGDTIKNEIIEELKGG